MWLKQPKCIILKKFVVVTILYLGSVQFTLQIFKGFMKLNKYILE